MSLIVLAKSDQFIVGPITAVPYSTASNPIVLVSNAGAASGDTNSVTTGAINTTGANFLVVILSSYLTVPTLTDSKSNSWSPLTLKTSVPGSNSRIYYSVPTSVGTGHTFTFTGSGDYPAMCVSAFSYVKQTSSADVENGAIGVLSATAQAGSITPTLDGDLIICGISTGSAGNGTSTHAMNLGFTVTDSIAYGNGVNLSCGMAYKVQVTAAAINPTWTLSDVVPDFACVIGSFKQL